MVPVLGVIVDRPQSPDELGPGNGSLHNLIGEVV